MSSDERYDRQLRLWGTCGQARLGSARVCLLGATSAGTEAVKNLVLPGVGGFTVVDGRKAAEAPGECFFQDAAGDVASSAARLLGELNPSVRPSFVSEHPYAYATSDPGFPRAFDLVIVMHGQGLTLAQVTEIATLCEARRVPYIAVLSCGSLVSTIRSGGPLFRTHLGNRDNPREDLRVLAGKVEFAREIEDRGPKSPWVAILRRMAGQWRAGFENGDVPREPSYADKKRIREAIRAEGEAVAAECGLGVCENYKEAEAAVLRSMQHPAPSSEVREALESCDAEGGPDTDADLVAVFRALREFVSAHDGVGPIPGSVPDMACPTATFVAVQKAYAAAHNTDVDEIMGILGRNGNAAISREFVSEVVRNFHGIRSRVFPPFSACLPGSQGSQGTPMGSGCADRFAMDPDDDCVWLLVTMVAEEFAQEKGRRPGDTAGKEADDAETLRRIAPGLLSKLSLPAESLPERYLDECVRMGRGSLHHVSAVVGGLVAQEAVKLITRQFTPAVGWTVYNGVRGTVSNLGF